MNRLDLCSMLKKKQPNGYYHCESSIVVGKKTYFLIFSMLSNNAEYIVCVKSLLISLFFCK